MSQKATVIAVVNQKGGTGKTTTCENLGVGLATKDKKKLIVNKRFVVFFKSQQGVVETLS